MIDQLAQALLRGRTADIESAKYVYLLSQIDAGATEINEALPKFGLSPLSKGYLSKLKTVYETWVVKRGKSEDELAPIGITKLYLIREQDDTWLDKAREYTDDELQEELKQGTRDKPLQQPFVTLRLPESTNQDLESALAYFRESVRHKVTMTQFLEIMAALVQGQESSVLLGLWNEAHGE